MSESTRRGAEPREPVPFVHLRLHTAYSLLEGALRIPEIGPLCRAHGMPAAAMTDSGNLFGALEFSERLAAEGIQPIVGLGLAVECAALGPEWRDPGRAGHRLPPVLALLAQNEAGYANLMKLSSRAYLETEAGQPPHLGLDRLAAHTDGLIALTGGPDGPVNRLLEDGRVEEADALIAELARLFPDRLYVELQRHGLRREDRAEGPLVDMAYARRLPLVATNECYFPHKDFYEAHDALICIAGGAYVMQDDRRRLTPEHYFKSGAEMVALFADLPEAVENTLEVAERCSFRVTRRKPILPAFDTGSDRSAAEELKLRAGEGLKERLEEDGAHLPEDVYWKRLDYEVGVITRMDFPGYFLIVSDFMKWARKKGIPVGVRGSGATSIVAWALEITSLDPLRFDLVFERFLNPERVSMPDFDIDFCQDRRSEVIGYVQEKYGHENVAQIITFGTLQARAAVRDVGRVLQMPYGQVDRICKMIPNPPGKPVKLAQAIAGEPRLQQMIRDEAQVARLMELARKLEGLYRHASTHAAGLVIGDRPLDQLVALYRDPRADMPVTQFHYKDAESIGLVKFDFLGLKTLTVIARTEDLLKRRGIEVNTERVPFDDAKTYEMLAHGDSVGVFQLESSGMRDLLRKMRPDRIEDLIALVALYRPGPMDSIPKYIACKHGREAPRYLHPLLEPILKETFGVMTYQEDVMQIARDLAGYSLGEADLLRRAMGKKIKSEMDKHRAKFIDGAGRNGVRREVAEQIFEQAAKFAGYGFNKGHAAAYAQVAYQTAWLKANYPVEFLAASMTLDMERADRLAIFRQEAERLGIKVLPPDVNRSEAVFTPAALDDGTPVIHFALAAIRNVGRAAMEHVVEMRKAGGPFEDLFDFASRVDPRVVTKRVFEGLAASGAFDGINPNRAQVMAAADLVLGFAARAAEDRDSSQTSLFGEARLEMRPPDLPPAEPWGTLDRLSREMEAVGFYLSGHPLDDVLAPLRRAGVVTYADLLAAGPRGSGAVRLAGTVIRRQEKRSRTDSKFAIVELSDPSGGFEVWLFSEVLSASRDLLEPGNAVVVSAAADWNGEDLRLVARKVDAVEGVADSASVGLRIYVEEGLHVPALKASLGGGGQGQVRLVLPLGGGLREIEYTLPGRYAVTSGTRGAVKAVTGVVHVEEL